MKKIEHQNRKLTVDRETIRRLSETALGQIAGGTDVSQGTACRTWCTPCTGTHTTTGPKLE